MSARGRECDAERRVIDERFFFEGEKSLEPFAALLEASQNTLSLAGFVE